MKTTNVDAYLDEQFRDKAFIECDERAGAAWEVVLQLAALRREAGVSQKELDLRLGASPQPMRIIACACMGIAWGSAVCAAPAIPPVQAPALVTVVSGLAVSDRSSNALVSVTNGALLSLSVSEAIVTALENNKALKVERINPGLKETVADVERAAFDPLLSANVQHKSSNAKQAVSSSTTHALPYPEGLAGAKDHQNSGEVGVSEFLPTGTRIALSGSGSDDQNTLYSDRFGESRVGMSVTQSLLRGLGVAVNLAALRVARINVRISEYELRGYMENLVARVESACWDYVLAQRQVDIVSDSLKVSERQLDETRERVKVGKLAPVELAASEADVALRKENLIDARSTLDKAQLLLMNLLSPPGAQPHPLNRPVQVTTSLDIPAVALDPVEAHVSVALSLRPDVNQARLALNRGDLEIVKTKNGLLPKLDVFVNLGKTGYSDSFGQSISPLADDDTYDGAIGIQGEYPWGHREAQAKHQRSVLSRKQQSDALDNLLQLAEVDVRVAYIEVLRYREQVAAKAVSRAWQEETARAELEKFRVGKSTSFLVSQADRNLLSAKIDEVRAKVSYLKSFVDLYRMEGSLLERRGVAAPGREPVEAGKLK